MSALEVAAIDSFRWIKINSRSKRHLWLGTETACGISKWHTISADAPEVACESCWMYARGWLDRHIHGANPPLDISPLAGTTRLPAKDAD